jgi:hypothetical protein
MSLLERVRRSAQCMGLGYSPNANPANLLAVSVTDSEVTERLRDIAFTGRELNLHTSISPASSSRPVRVLAPPRLFQCPRRSPFLPLLGIRRHLWVPLLTGAYPPGLFCLAL